MHEVLVNRLGGLSLPRKSVVRLTDRPDMTLDVYRGRKTTIQQLELLFASNTHKRETCECLRLKIPYLPNLFEHLKGANESRLFLSTCSYEDRLNKILSNCRP